MVAWRGSKGLDSFLHLPGVGPNLLLYGLLCAFDRLYDRSLDRRLTYYDQDRLSLVERLADLLQVLAGMPALTPARTTRYLGAESRRSGSQGAPSAAPTRTSPLSSWRTRAQCPSRWRRRPLASSWRLRGCLVCPSSDSRCSRQGPPKSRTNARRPRSAGVSTGTTAPRLTPNG